jgi:DNA-binding NarL/FixJ family response regulator
VHVVTWPTKTNWELVGSETTLTKYRKDRILARLTAVLSMGLAAQAPQQLGLPPNRQVTAGEGPAGSEHLVETWGLKIVRILVADDHDIFRRGLKQLLAARPGWDVCAEAKTGREAVDLAERFKPEIVVMDISMPELNGLEAARRIRKILPKTEIVILTLHFSDQLVKEIVNSGARAYVMKSDADRDLVTAVEALVNHRPFFTARAASILFDDFRKTNGRGEPQVPSRGRLTSREREILQLVAEGKSSKEVATALSLSIKTAETHRANIMRKLDMHSISELVRYAVKNQIIEV